MSTSTETLIPTGTWNVDPAHSKVGFAVKHMGIATVRGEFTEFAGSLEDYTDLILGKNALGTFTGMGAYAYGVATSGSGATSFFDASDRSWWYTHGRMTAISLGANNTLWGVKSGGVYNFQAWAASWTLASTLTATQVSAGDGVHPWTVDATGSNVYRYEGGSFALKLTSATLGNDPIARVAVGSDDDAWVITKAGKVWYAMDVDAYLWWRQIEHRMKPRSGQAAPQIDV